MKGITVVKLGGSLLEIEESRLRALRAIASASAAGQRLVVVHGGGKAVDAALLRAGIPKRTAGGLRVTDAATLPIVVSVLAGTVNKSLVSELVTVGAPAVGISGADAMTLLADFHPPVDGVELGFVGSICRTDPALLLTLLGSEFVPVMATIAIGPDGVLLNVNADTAASAVAVGLGADRLVFLTDVEGVLDGDGTLLESIDRTAAEELLQSSAVTGGMRPKLAACLAAIYNGVPEVLISGPSRHASSLIDGRGGTHLVAA